MKRRDVEYADEGDCIADIERLRASSRGAGAWSLAQTCWHLEFPVTHSLRPPETTEATPEQQKRHASLDRVIASGWPAGLSSPAEMVPPADAGPEAIDALVTSLHQLRAYEPPYVDAFLFGPVETAKFRRFILVHAAHHLGFFEPEGPTASG